MGYPFYNYRGEYIMECTGPPRSHNPVRRWVMVFPAVMYDRFLN